MDAAGVDRIQASQHDANRTDHTFEAVKTSLLIDCETRAIRDSHCSMKQSQDTPVGRHVLTRNMDELSAVAADTGYDWLIPRTKLRAEGVKPMIQMRGPRLRG